MYDYRSKRHRCIICEVLYVLQPQPVQWCHAAHGTTLYVQQRSYTVITFWGRILTQCCPANVLWQGHTGWPRYQGLQSQRCLVTSPWYIIKYEAPRTVFFKQPMRDIKLGGGSQQTTHARHLLSRLTARIVAQPVGIMVQIIWSKQAEALWARNKVSRL